MKSLLDFSCPGCGKTADGHGLCPECRKRVRPVKPPRCPGCGGESDGVLAECRQCLAAGDRPWDKAFAAYDYAGVIRELIVQLKFHHRPENGILLAQLAAELSMDFLMEYDLIVPVPLHFIRRLKRGYNQSAIIARELSSITGIPCRNLLRRKKYSAPQSRQSRQVRLKALKNAFVLPPDQAPFVSGKRVLLLDDVFTTGATLDAAARAIQFGNPAAIGVFTLAKRGTM